MKEDIRNESDSKKVLNHSWARLKNPKLKKVSDLTVRVILVISVIITFIAYVFFHDYLPPIFTGFRGAGIWIFVVLLVLTLPAMSILTIIDRILHKRTLSQQKSKREWYETKRK